MEKVSRFLLIDDDPILAMTTRWTLEAIGINEIVEVRNGQLALDWLNQQFQPLDLVLLDLQMPVMDGIEFLEALSQLDHIAGLIDRIVVLTSMQHPGIRKQVEALGVKWYVTRPLTTDAILAILTDLASGTKGQETGMSR